jgi:hypothetical protein
MPKELLVVSGKIILKTDKNNNNKNRMFPLSLISLRMCGAILSWETTCCKPNP